MNKHPPFWHFWNPNSGFPGGMIAFITLSVVYLIVMLAIYWFVP